MFYSTILVAIGITWSLFMPIKVATSNISKFGKNLITNPYFEIPIIS
jgi:hypothetical protein